MSNFLIVSGTGTGVGKTVVTAAIAALAARSGMKVAVVKPGQTGVRGDDIGDVDDVWHLSGVEDVHELARFPDPLSPATAARISGKKALGMKAAAERIRDIGATRDLVLVEGAGGLLVQYNERGATIADLATKLSAPVLLVVLPNLGTLNHTALSLNELARREIHSAGVVIGRWPEHPDLACRTNITDLEDLMGAPLKGAIRDNAGQLAQTEFLPIADAGIAPELGGHFDAADFRSHFAYGGTHAS